MVDAGPQRADDAAWSLPTPTGRVDIPDSVREPVAVPRRLPMWPIRAAAVLGATGAFGLAGWQISRAMAGQPRLASISAAEVVLAALAAAAVVLWTWVVVENARRLLSLGYTKDPPSPAAVSSAWAPPLLFVGFAVASIAYLERRLNDPSVESTSTIPLALSCAALVATLFVSYRPLFLLSAIMRRLGGGVGDLARWVWVPISMVVVGAASLVALRAGGAYGDDVEGFAPAWAIGVVAIPPLVILLSLAWKGCAHVEEVVALAFARTAGASATGAGRRDLGLVARALRADARPPIHRDLRARVRLLPGAGPVRLLVMVSVASLTLISVVGALVMVLFWREAADGALLPSQRDRAWDALAVLQRLERAVATIALAVVAAWSFVTVLNARIASGRRRNPLLAAAAWPAAGAAVWSINDRLSEADGVAMVVGRFALQALALYVPVLLLERTALTVGARRTPLRLTWAIGVVLFVHVQGLGGLATLQEEADVSRFGRIAGYLALAVLLELIATITVADATRQIGDASSAIADKHNFLAEQRSLIGERAEQREVRRASSATGSAAAEPPGEPTVGRRRRDAARPGRPEPDTTHESAPASSTAPGTTPLGPAPSESISEVVGASVIGRGADPDPDPDPDPGPGPDPDPAVVAPSEPAESRGAAGCDDVEPSTAQDPSPPPPAARTPMFIPPLVLRSSTGDRRRVRSAPRSNPGEPDGG